MDYTLGEIIRTSVLKNSEKPALNFVGDHSLTYSRMLEQIESVQFVLEKQGIKKGDRVAILGSNQPNWGISYFAITFMGAVAAPILPDFHENEIENVVNHSEAKAIFIGEALYRKIIGLDAPNLQTQILI